MWFAVYNGSMVAMLGGILTLLCYLAIRLTFISGPFYLLLPLPFLVVMFWHHCETKIKTPCLNLSLERAKDLDKRAAASKLRGEGTPLDQFSKDLYKQPSLATGQLKPALYRKNKPFLPPGLDVMGASSLKFTPSDEADCTNVSTKKVDFDSANKDSGATAQSKNGELSSGENDSHSTSVVHDIESNFVRGIEEHKNESSIPQESNKLGLGTLTKALFVWKRPRKKSLTPTRADVGYNESEDDGVSPLAQRKRRRRPQSVPSNGRALRADEIEQDAAVTSEIGSNLQLASGVASPVAAVEIGSVIAHEEDVENEMNRLLEGSSLRTSFSEQLSHYHPSKSLPRKSVESGRPSLSMGNLPPDNRSAVPHAKERNSSNLNTVIEQEQSPIFWNKKEVKGGDYGSTGET